MISKNPCSNQVSHKKIALKEKRSTLVLINEKQVVVDLITVDGCKITSGPRCDFMVLVANVATEYFIELKGIDVNHAVTQLTETIKKLSSNATSTLKVSFIICTRSPLSSAEIQGYQIRFKRDFNARLIVKSTPFQYKLDN